MNNKLKKLSVLLFLTTQLNVFASNELPKHIKKNKYIKNIFIYSIATTLAHNNFVNNKQNKKNVYYLFNYQDKKTHYNDAFFKNAINTQQSIVLASSANSATNTLASITNLGGFRLINNNNFFNSYVPKDYYFAKENFLTKNKYHEFNGVFTFSDSLMDTGSFSRKVVYMANGDINFLANSLISEKLSGKPQIPFTLKGNKLQNHSQVNNYSASGAVVGEFGKPQKKVSRRSINAQIDYYLADYNKKADPNSIYIYWAGGNDLANKMATPIFSAILSFGDKDKFNQIFDQKAYFSDKELISNMVQSVGKLLDAGAGYVYFLNLPASGYAPFTQMLLEGATFGSADLIIEENPFILLSPNYWLSKISDDYLRNPAFHIGDPRGRGKDYIIENNIASLKHRYFFLPTSLLSFYYNFSADIQNAFIRQFNNEAKRQLTSIGYKGNIIYADVDALFTEIMDNYQDFGIDEVLVPQCQLGLQSTSCNATDARFHNDRIYAFTDWHHPSAYSHLMIAQYMQSILDAPVFISSLVRHSNNISNNNNKYINKLLTNLEFNNTNEVFVTLDNFNNKFLNTYINQKHTNTQNIRPSIKFGVSDKDNLGIIFNYSYSKNKPSKGIDFIANSYGISSFYSHKFEKVIFSNYITYSFQDFNNINRNIWFGGDRGANRTEKSSANGKSFSFSSNIIYNLFSNDILEINPVFKYTYNLNKVDSIVENSNLSTSMQFGEQLKKESILTAGLISLSKKDEGFNYNIDFNINYKFKNSKDIISNNSIKSSTVSFSRAMLPTHTLKSRFSFELNPGVSYKFKDNKLVEFNTFYEFNKNYKNINYSITYKHKF